MPDNTNQDNTNQQDTNQQNNNTQQNMGSGKKYAVGMDSNESADSSNLEKFCQTLEQCGNTVQHTQIGPNQETYLPELSKQMGGADACIFLCALAPATVWSFRDAVKAGTLPFTIFGNEGWISSYKTMEDIRNAPWEPEHDAGQFMSASSVSQMKSEAKTMGEWLDKNSQYISICVGSSPEELAQNICSGSCGGGGGGSGSVVSSGGGAQVKDKTFEKCIRRICAATDSIFLVENNAAVLFPYTDWMAFTLRQKISTIKKNEIDPKVFSMEYGNDGFYNKVSIAWGGATLPERFPDKKDSKKQVAKDIAPKSNYTVDDILSSMEQNNFKISNLSNTKQDKKTTTKNKKNKTTQEISVDENGVTLLSEQYDAFVEKYGEQEKRVQSSAPDLETAQYIVNALLIQYIRDYNYQCKCRAINNRKYIGGTFYAVENPFDNNTELFYLNGYTMRTQKHEPMYYDLDFRYGPEGAEELSDYQTLSGGAVSGSTNTTIGGGSATEEQIWKGAQKACHQWTCGNLRVEESDTQDPQVAEDYYNKMVKTGKKFCLTCYGMSSWLYYQFNYKANIPCQVVGDSSHHVVMIDRGNGFVETRDEYRKYLEEGYRWKGSQPTTVLLAAPSAATSSGGNTNNKNNNGGNGDGH